MGLGRAPSVEKRQLQALNGKPEDATPAVEADDARNPTDEKTRRGKKRKQSECQDVATAPEESASHKQVKGDTPRRQVAQCLGAEEVAAAEVDIDPNEFRAKMQISCRGRVEVPDPVQRLSAAPFSKKIRRALSAAGFVEPTPIQAQGWPVAVRGDDLVAVAKTGSGKTLGFMLPGFRKVSKEQPDSSDGPVVLVLAPTRELVMQIEKAATEFQGHLGVKTLAIFGGVPKPPQVRALRSDLPQVLIATPGRLVDLMNDGIAKVGNVSFLVLDEADRMLDMGFEPQMEIIMKQIPTERQTLLFTATWPRSVQKLASKYLKADAVHVNVGETEDLAANRAVKQEFLKRDDDEKEMALWKIIEPLSDDAKIIVFANTKRRIDKLQKEVWSFGWTCVAMHGDKLQQEREKGLKDFMSGNSPLMFATDVCARGLDIKGVTHIVNFDMARDVESYIHRIGRTGRAGETGTSITFFNEAYDLECAPALVKIAREAGQEVPEFLEKAAAKAKASKLWRY